MQPTVYTKEGQIEQNARRVFTMITGRTAPATIRISGRGDNMTINDVPVFPKALIPFVLAQGCAPRLISAKLHTENQRIRDAQNVLHGPRNEIEKALRYLDSINVGYNTSDVTLLFRDQTCDSVNLVIYTASQEIPVKDEEVARSIVKYSTRRFLRRDQSPASQSNTPALLLVGLGIAALGYYLYRRK
tara:strand:- start:559 stop:1122 length:564 start_codon:yes stop_codon:yes gene_type:complete